MVKFDFANTLNHVFVIYNLKNVDIAEKAGMAPESISRYRNGHKDMTLETFMQLVGAMPPQASMEIMSAMSFHFARLHRDNLLQEPPHKQILGTR